MKMKIVIMMLAATFSASAYGQTQEATQLLLNYEKLKQLEEILDNMYKGYQILTTGYNRIRDIAEGNYKLHQVFLDGLLAVNPKVAQYKRIPQIIRYQSLLMSEYKRAFQRFRNDQHLSRDEIDYLQNVYSHLVRQSRQNLDEVTMILTANKLRMNDDERLQAIDRIHADMESKLSFLRHLNNTTQLLVAQRAKETSEVGAMKGLYKTD